MAEIRVTFQTENGNAEKTIDDVFLDSTLRDAREAIPMLLGLPENTPYRFFLARTRQILSDNQTFKEADVKDDDIIILISKDQLPNIPISKYHRLNGSTRQEITNIIETSRPLVKNSYILFKEIKKLVFSLVKMILVLISNLLKSR